MKRPDFVLIQERFIIAYCKCAIARFYILLKSWDRGNNMYNVRYQELI